MIRIVTVCAAILIAAVSQPANAGLILVKNVNVTGGNQVFDSILSPDLIQFYNYDLGGLKNAYFLQETGASSITSTTAFQGVNFSTAATQTIVAGSDITGSLMFHLEPQGLSPNNSINIQFDIDASQLAANTQLFLVRDGQQLINSDFLNNGLGTWNNTQRGFELDDSISFTNISPNIYRFEVSSNVALNNMDQFRIVGAITAVPEPTSMILTSLAIGAFGLTRCKKRFQKKA